MDNSQNSWIQLEVDNQGSIDDRFILQEEDSQIREDLTETINQTSDSQLSTTNNNITIPNLLRLSIPSIRNNTTVSSNSNLAFNIELSYYLSPDRVKEHLNKLNGLLNEYDNKQKQLEDQNKELKKRLKQIARSKDLVNSRKDVSEHRAKLLKECIKNMNQYYNTKRYFIELGANTKKQRPQAS